MEAKVYRAMVRWLLSIAPPRRRARQQFGDRWIIMIYLWSVINDRPVCWACDEQNWPKDQRDGRPLPSDATMSRRLRTVGVLQLLERLLTKLTDALPVPLVKTLRLQADAGRRLLQGCRRGARTAGRAAVRPRLPPARAVSRPGRARVADRADEPPTTRRSARACCRGWRAAAADAVGDNAYDTNDCHREAAAADHQLVAPPRFVNRHVRDARRNVPQRLRALDLLASPLERCGEPNRFGIALYNARESVESCFGELSMRGLNYLPAWVRGPRRVALRTAGKLALHAQRCVQRTGVSVADAKG